MTPRAATSCWIPTAAGLVAWLAVGMAAPAADGWDLLRRQIQEREPGVDHWEQRTARVVSEALHPEALLHDGDRDPADVAIRRTRALLGDIREMAGAPDLGGADSELKSLEARRLETPVSEEAARRALYKEAIALRRRIAFANPLLDFDRILFLKKHRARYAHMCDQYFGFGAVPGGGVFVLEDPWGPQPVARNLFEHTPISRGRLEGRTLDEGSCISLELSYDGSTIYFAWTEAAKTEYEWSPESTYHIMRANADGTGLVQLTDGPWNDFDPCELPNGRIAFISERRGGFGRCHGRPVPTYTLHTMDPDGGDLRAISFHETNEWHPSVNNDGLIVYTRWDYVDRDSDIAHHIWLTYPDGRDPRSYHGNYPLVRELRPWMEMSLRAIPGSQRYVGVAAPHHGQAYGSLVLIDQRLDDDRAMSQVLRATPEVRLPESESAPGERNGTPGRPRKGGRDAEVFGSPWPLNEDHYLCVYDPGAERYGVALVDGFGNREMLFQDDEVPCLDPLPLRPRPRPPVVPDRTEAVAGDAEPVGRIAVMNVYDADFQWPEGAKVAALRVIQLFPKTTPKVDEPRIGLGDQSLARGVLGTVPVEADGSAYFEAPANVPLYFQALDGNGLAIQNMRSNTYLHAGETLTCQGCHEPKRRIASASVPEAPIALRREPSRIQPEFDGAFPLSFPRLVQDVLDRHCVECHEKEKDAPSLRGDKFGANGWSEAFLTLSRRGWARSGGNGALHQKNGNESRSIAGSVGARASKLYRMLEKGHEGVQLPPEDMQRITLWLDCNTNFYGAYHETAEQARGGVVMPTVF